MRITCGRLEFELSTFKAHFSSFQRIQMGHRVWQQVFNLDYKMCSFIIADVTLNIHICALHVSIMSSEKEKKTVLHTYTEVHKTSTTDHNKSNDNDVKPTMNTKYLNEFFFRSVIIITILCHFRLAWLSQFLASSLTIKEFLFLFYECGI